MKTLMAASLSLLLLLQANTYIFKEVIKPSEPFSTDWAFVIDNSSSIWWKPERGVIEKILTAFDASTEHPGDELHFCTYAFHDKYRTVYRKWAPASLDAFSNTKKWLAKNRGTHSHGKKAIGLALHQKKAKLSVIIITDGGFTSAGYGKGFGSVRKEIEAGQAWRVANGYSEAIICTVGIENKDYIAGGKPTDEDCQAFLLEIGKKYGGGYFLVSKSESER